jgi:hypothetical protein
MKNYSTPNLTVHGSVESMTQVLGVTDKNDFLFFNGGTTPVAVGGTTIQGNGSYDGNISPTGVVTPSNPRTLQNK